MTPVNSLDAPYANGNADVILPTCSSDIDSDFAITGATYVNVDLRNTYAAYVNDMPTNTIERVSTSRRDPVSDMEGGTEEIASSGVGVADDARTTRKFAGNLLVTCNRFDVDGSNVVAYRVRNGAVALRGTAAEMNAGMFKF